MKLTAYTFMGMLLLGFLNFSCGKKNGGISGANDNTIDSTRLEELFVWVENARIRKEADLNAEVITEIKGGEKVTLTGEISTNKIKIKLRGVDFEDVWVKVTTSTGKEGWVFKGMLTDDETQATAMNDFLIVPGIGVGQVRIGNTQKDVEKIFGEQFITSGIIYDKEFDWPGFYIFKNSPHELQCAVDEKTGNVFNIIIRQPGGYWATAEGVKIGTKLDDLVKMNGKPISFSGFGYVYAGTLRSFNKGKLSIYQDNLGIVIGEPDNLEGLDEFMGDKDCSTSNKKILDKGVKVAEINIFAGAIL